MTTTENKANWTLPILDHLAGPSDLVDVVCDYLTFHGNFYKSILVQKDRLRALVNVIFYASLAPEEGRFQRFRVFVASSGGGHTSDVASFDIALTEARNSVEVLKRLAPAADSLNHMIVVEDKGGEWRCTGLASVAPLYTSEHIGRPEWHALFPDKPTGVTIRVDAPGALRIEVAGAAFRMRSGNLQQSIPLMYSPQVVRCVAGIGVELAKTEEIAVKRLSRGYDVQKDLAVAQILDHVVAEMQSAGFGGCLLFPGPNGQERIVEKILSQGPSVGKRLVDFYRAAMKFRSEPKGIEEFRRYVADWQRSISNILRAAEAVAMMSRTDGCVVLNRHFEVTSFGSKLNVSSKEEGLPLVDPFMGLPEDETSVRRLGTRNQSAYDFCRTVPESTAIVVSQDGDVRVASSSDQAVTFVEGFEAASVAKHNW